MRTKNALRAILLTIVYIAVVLASPQQVAADTLYGATGSNGIAGHLLILDPTTGDVITDVGALLDSAGNGYGMTGLAFDPATGNLFGSVANSLGTPTAKSHLVLINPGTAQVTDIGSFGFAGSTMSDIAFDPVTGILYGWRSAEGHGLYTIDILTGTATLVGGTTDDFGGGGLAANSNSTIFNTPDGVTGLPSGHLTTVDKTTGATTVIGLLSGSFTTPVINAMDFDSSGVLFGVQTNRGNPALTHLVIIDSETAAITDLGSSIDNLDAIAFLHPTAPEPLPEPDSIFLLGLSLVVVYCWAMRRRISECYVRIRSNRRRH